MTSARSAYNRTRAESFGSLAADYDRFRPSYPSRLIDDLVAPGPADALDVGCGTGQLARLLIGRGVDTLGVEVDDRMARVARAHGVPVETAAFEDWPAHRRRVDLVVCAQAWHWIDPDRGPAKAADVLRPGGRLALVWNFVEFDPEVGRALDAAYEACGSPLGAGSVLRGGGPGTLHAVPDQLRAGGLFGPVERREYEWAQDYPRDRWLAMISTHSDHSTLPADRLAAVRTEVGAAIDRLGGVLPARYRTHALTAPVTPAARRP